MQFFKFWAKATVSWVDEHGWESVTTAYAGSDTSQADAQALADARLAQRLQWFRNGKPARDNPFRDYDLSHDVPGKPIREVMVWRQDGPDGQPTAAITRSNNGYLVLNTTQLMIVDVDHLPRPAAQQVKQAVRGWWARLWGAAPESPPSSGPVPSDPVAAALQPFLSKHPDWGLRVYKTFAGYRYLITHAPLDARQPKHLKVLLTLHADPLYVRLCWQQGCYRARLTPKAHRVGWRKPAQTYPYTSQAEQAAQRDWEDSYAAISERYSTVELVGQYGKNTIHPDLRPLIDLHDQHALKRGLPLA